MREHKCRLGDKIYFLFPTYQNLNMKCTSIQEDEISEINLTERPDYRSYIVETKRGFKFDLERDTTNMTVFFDRQKAENKREEINAYLDNNYNAIINILNDMKTKKITISEKYSSSRESIDIPYDIKSEILDMIISAYKESKQ